MASLAQHRVLNCYKQLADFFFEVMVLSSVFDSFGELDDVLERFEFSQRFAFVEHFLEKTLKVSGGC